MKLSKEYLKLEKQFSELTENNRQSIDVVKEDIETTKHKQASEAKRAESAACTGDEGLYREAMISKQFSEDRLKYLADRLKSLQSDPLSDPAEVKKMLAVLSSENERLQNYVNTEFRKKYSELADEALDLISDFALLQKAKEQIHAHVAKDGANIGSCYPAPAILTNLKRSIAHEVSAGSLSGFSNKGYGDVAGSHDAEYQEHFNKWNV